MKKTICVLMVFCCFISVNARKRKRYKPVKRLNYSRVDAKFVHFGFTVGTSILDFDVRNSDYNLDQSYRAEQIDFSPGVTLAIISEWNINRNFGLRLAPGFTFGNRELTYVNVDEDYPEKVKLETFYVDFPFLLKYKSKRINNYRPYAISGINFRFDLSPHTTLSPSKKEVIKIRREDIAFEIGAGIDFYLPYFKLSTELKISIGLKDIMIHVIDEEYPDYAQYTDAIGYMNSKVVTLSFHFE